jgi:hypothetical protein
LIKVGEFFKAHKLPLAMIIVAGVLIFYAVGIATFFGSPVFSMFWIISAQTAHVLIYVAVVVAVVLGVMGSIIGFIKRRSVHVQVDSLQAQADSSGELHNEANGMLEEQPTLLENKEKAALRSSELLGVINASVGIVDLSFDVLIGLNENRINWQQLDGYSNGFGENFSFAGQSMPPLNLDFSKVFSAIKSRIPEETAKETYNILEAVYVYFNGSNFDDDIKESLLNFQNAKDVILAYFLLNDLLLGMVVGDKENKDEKGQLETVLQNLGKKSNFKVNVEELKGNMDKAGLESDVKSVIDVNRGILKAQLKQFPSDVSARQKM